MQVKTWQPNPGCKQCAQAEKNNRESAASGERIYSTALKQSKNQYAEIQTLKARVKALEDVLTEAVEYLDYNDLPQIGASSALHMTMIRALKPNSEDAS